MKLLRLADVPPGGDTLVCRRSPVRAVAGYALGWLAAVGLAGFAWRQGSWLLGYLAAVLALVLLLARGAVRARLGPANWLVRAGGVAGLHVQFRSHLNHHLPAEDATVVFVPYSEVRSARLVRERRTLAYRDAGHRSEREVLEWRSFVELELAADTAPLAQALAEEAGRKAPRVKRWYGSSATTYRHYPVRLSSPTTLEIEWQVAPGAGALLDHMSRFVRVDPLDVRTTDFRDVGGLDRAEQDRRIATLAQTGQQMAAVSLARTLFGLDLREARELVDRVRQTPHP